MTEKNSPPTSEDQKDKNSDAKDSVTSSAEQAKANEKEMEESGKENAA
jgi:hypothetical protein